MNQSQRGVVHKLLLSIVLTTLAPIFAQAEILTCEQGLSSASRLRESRFDEISSLRARMDWLTKNNKLIGKFGSESDFTVGRGLVDYDHHYGPTSSVSRPLTREELGAVARLNPVETYALIHGDTDNLKSPNEDFKASLVYGYASDLSRLHGSAHVLDLGAGDFTQTEEILSAAPAFISQFRDSLKDYFHRPLSDRPRVTAVTLNPTSDGLLRKQRLEKTGRAHLLAGRKFEEISDVELLGEFGQVDIVVDVFGVFRYSTDLPLVIEKLSRIVKPGGRLYAANTCAQFIINGSTYSLPEFLEFSGAFNRVGIPMQESDDYLRHRRTYWHSKDSMFVRRDTPAIQPLKYSIHALEPRSNGGNCATYVVQWKAQALAH